VFASGSGDESAFNGLVAVLIDERTDRRGELLALELEVAGARLLGNATAGALSPVSWLALPGRLRIGMPLVEVRRADGGQLHRVGLSPSVELRPTARGVRDGADDVLDRAIAWVQQQLSPAPRRRR
jgi:C-terminal processing protease CtpA/Prc